MSLMIEKYISNFIQTQFPEFYREEGPIFIEFVKAYYEWMEEQGNPIGEARNLYDYRDIDNTLTAFLEHFQKKYLYGIPFNTIINKRFLLKHVLDIYRSKGSIQCYKLLFKLIYNQDIEIYLPGRDILKASDGTWVEPKFLELGDGVNLQDYVGKTIVGLTSGTIAVVESYISEVISGGRVNTFYLTNINPNGGTFVKGEKILIQGKTDSQSISSAPVVLGSLDSVNIVNGGQDFNIGDLLKIVHYDVSGNSIVSFGDGGILKVTGVERKSGALQIQLQNGGFGYTQAPDVFLYNAPGDSGTGATFNIGSLSYVQTVTYNTDLLCDYLNISLDSLQYGLPANTAANLSSVIQTSLTYTSNQFGSIASLNQVGTGNSYFNQPTIFVRSDIESKNLPGTIVFSSNSNVITGTNTSFTTYFTSNSIIVLEANSTVYEKQVVQSVANDTSIILYGNPKTSNNTGTNYRVASVIFPSNFLPIEPIMTRPDGTINGINEIIKGYPSYGNNIVSSAIAIDSGKGYIDGEFVKAYRYGGLAQPQIINGGYNYSNGDVLIFTGGGTTSYATGYVTTDSNGTINSAVLTYNGSGYITIPTISIKTKGGYGALLSVNITEYNTQSFIQGIVIKTGMGKSRGHWTTTHGFLNSDKYIQDSYFYQDFSYQIKVATTLDKYKSILYNTFHTSGSELFGEFLLNITESSNAAILYEQSSPIFTV